MSVLTSEEVEKFKTIKCPFCHTSLYQEIKLAPMRGGVNILIGKYVKESDKKLFFEPLGKDEPFKTFPSDIKWEQLLRELGICSSSSEAFRNSWCGEIPEGFSDHWFGKYRKRVTILKITDKNEYKDLK